MNNSVYFLPAPSRADHSAFDAGLRRLLLESNAFGTVASDDSAVVKMHFGEEGNTGHVSARHIAVIAKQLRSKTESVIVSDTNTLYRGKRTASVEHEKLACEHGFSPENTGAALLVPDETNKANCLTVKVKGKFVKEAKILRLYKEAATLVGVAHFKGHMVTGFGGAIKNIGMGCASREGKLAQHSTVSPVVRSKQCTGCEACKAVCPANAISIVNGRARLNQAACIGCASCIAACTFGAMDVNWGVGSDTLMERMVEYAAAVLLPQKNAFFFNFAIKITRECDCMAKDDPRIVDDVGIFASTDPVALDQATFDEVKRKAGGEDLFAKLHPGRDGLKQLAYAEKIGLGSRAYKLVAV